MNSDAEWIEKPNESENENSSNNDYKRRFAGNKVEW